MRLFSEIVCLYLQQQLGNLEEIRRLMKNEDINGEDNNLNSPLQTAVLTGLFISFFFAAKYH